jgi:hypothetical protein
VPTIRPADAVCSTSHALLEQLIAARSAIYRHIPEGIVTLGGDCHVDLAPIAQRAAMATTWQCSPVETFIREHGIARLSRKDLASSPEHVLEWLRASGAPSPPFVALMVAAARVPWRAEEVPGPRDRDTNSAAYQMLNRSARRMLAVIECEVMRGGGTASISYEAFRLDHHFGRQVISRSLKLLDHLGFVDIRPGARLVNIFTLSDRWLSADQVEAGRLAALAREVKPHRTFERRPAQKPAPAPQPRAARPEAPPQRL